MAQIEKTNQIDKYLDQIDKKQDSSFKKRLVLLVGLLFVTVGCIFAYNQFAGKDTLANNNANSANASNAGNPATTIYASNDQDDVTDDELIAELEAEEAAAAALLEEEANAEEDEDAKKNEQAEDAKKNDAKPSSPTPGISERSFTADQLPSSVRSSATVKSGTSPKTSSPKEDAKEEDVVEEEDVLTEKGGEKVADEPVVEEEVVEVAPEPEVIEEAPKPVSAPKGVTKDPSYPGGEANMRKFFSKRITYPTQAINNKIEGNVNVKIKVNAKGKIIDSQVVKGIGSGCDREVLRAINRMPKWEPAMENGEAVAKHYLLSVAFKLPK